MLNVRIRTNYNPSLDIFCQRPALRGGYERENRITRDRESASLFTHEREHLTEIGFGGGGGKKERLNYPFSAKQRSSDIYITSSFSYSLLSFHPLFTDSREYR